MKRHPGGTAGAPLLCGRNAAQQRAFNLSGARGYLREAREWFEEGAIDMALSCIRSAGYLSRRAPAAAQGRVAVDLARHGVVVHATRARLAR